MSSYPVKTATVMTHRKIDGCKEVLTQLMDFATNHEITLRFDPEETQKHSIQPSKYILTNVPIDFDVQLCITLGGDGTILRALRTYSATDVPVFGINFGEIGFLSTVEKNGIKRSIETAFSLNFDVMKLPAVQLACNGQQFFAINDITVSRKPGMRVARLAYAVGGDEVGEVRCDGLVVCTPAGSTGYNLANGGPIMAWGVKGLAVSFIAAHSLSARVLIVAPDDVLTIHNRSAEEPVAIAIDGQALMEIQPFDKVDVEFVPDKGTLAQVPGANFYHRLRERFGRLAT